VIPKNEKGKSWDKNRTVLPPRPDFPEMEVSDISDTESEGSSVQKQKKTPEKKPPQKRKVRSPSPYEDLLLSLRPDEEDLIYSDREVEDLLRSPPPTPEPAEPTAKSSLKRPEDTVKPPGTSGTFQPKKITFNDLETEPPGNGKEPAPKKLKEDRATPKKKDNDTPKKKKRPPKTKGEEDSDSEEDPEVKKWLNRTSKKDLVKYFREHFGDKSFKPHKFSSRKK
jgi:hypothetical protein